MTPAKRLALVAMIGAIVLDQASKIWLIGKLAGGRVIEVTPFFKLVQVWNHGVSFGMFNHHDNPATQRSILVLLTVAIILGLLQWLKRTEKKRLGFALGLIIGGALGNLLDRFHYGAVADFLYFHLGQYYWPAFNLADSCIVIGVGLILLDSAAVKDKSARFSGD
jgi:signal peptidase II